ncbi:hypothetical protein CVU75_03020 [Candidatus Dependentiae bacterium HGW-Dependentiae-1]|nr:MAG: hypothetical protein CVU75_03020 [Candidatus Dependentiae bacterium HGW-Dependentiae-1]
MVMRIFFRQTLMRGLGVLFLGVGIFFSHAIACAMGSEPSFVLGAPALMSHQNPVNFGYRLVPVKQVVNPIQPQKILIQYPQGFYSFALLEGLYPSQKGLLARIRWIQDGEKKVLSAVMSHVYVHSSWMPEKVAPTTLSGWLASVDFLTSGGTFISKQYFAQRRYVVQRLLNEALKEGAWYNNEDAFQEGLTDNSSWYVQKKEITQEDTVFFFGDIHGDVQSLLNALQQLEEEGYLSNDFVLKKNTHLIFLGDYTDRGPCGLEVLCLLFTLKMVNSTQVTLLRGNHESASMNERYGFAKELKHKLFLVEEDDRDAYIYNFYDLLPVALYLGFKGDEGHQHWALCCHGGPEIGFSARDFLISDARYCSIKELKRDFYMQQLPMDLRREIISTSPVLPANYASEGIGEEFTQKEDRGDVQLGFLWNDFVLSGNCSFVFNEARGAALGRRLTKELLARDGLEFVMRGHQHSGEFLNTLYVQGGHVALFNGQVNTLISGNIDLNDPGLLYSFVRFSYIDSSMVIGWDFQPFFSKRSRRIVAQG